jgi:hypothetical protein
VRKNVALPSSGAACCSPHHPVSRPSSRCARELSDKGWGWENWSAPQRRVPTPHRRPAAGARAGDAAPGVKSRGPSSRIPYLQVLAQTPGTQRQRTPARGRDAAAATDAGGEAAPPPGAACA